MFELNNFANFVLYSKSLEVIADLDKPEDSKNLIDTTIAKFGRLDVLVNNAAEFNCSSNIEAEDALQVFDKVRSSDPSLNSWRLLYW